MPLAVLLAAAGAIPGAAAEVSVTPCDDGPRADAIAEPWEQNTATFSEGQVRLAAIDTIEPAGAPFHLMVLTPPLDEVGGRLCRLVGPSPGTGFFGIDFADRKAAYVPGQGLTVTVAIKEYDPEAGDGVPARLTVTIDQSTGKVTAKTAR